VIEHAPILPQATTPKQIDSSELQKKKKILEIEQELTGCAWQG